MKNTLRKTLAIVLCLALFTGCFAFSGMALNDEYLTYTVKDDGTAELKKCDKAAVGTVVVPSVIKIKGKAYDVTSIGKSAFEDCTKVTSISISEGITSIDSRAFADCAALEEVYVPQSLSVCQYTAFAGCSSVLVHCYSSNYQFFTVYGLSENLKIHIVDGEEDSESSGSDVVLTNLIVDLIRKIILMILSLFLN